MSHIDRTEKDYHRKIQKRYKKYEYPPDKPSFKKLCFPEKFTYQLPQLFVSKFMSPNTKNKGLVVFHKIGAGKTCLAVLTALQWYKKKRVIFIVPASLVPNVYKEFMSECAGQNYVSNKERKLLSTLHPSTEEYKQLVNEINSRIDNDIEIYSFHKYIKLYNQGDIDLNNAFLIIDEVQNIVSEKGLFYSSILQSIEESPSSTRIMIMSGTPIFDKPSELGLTINLLKPKDKLPIGKEFNDMFLHPVNGGYTIKNQPILEKLLKGYVSYSPGAPSIAFPKEILHVVKCPMSAFQTKSYKMIEKQEGNPDFQDILKLSNAFFIGSRMISNIAYPNKKPNKSGLDSFKGKRLHFSNIGKYSSKLEKCISKIKSISGPAIFYSNFREYGGIEPLIKILEYNGFIYVFDENANKKRYNKKRFAIWSGKEPIDEKETARNIYNDPKNIDASMLKLMIISPSGKEGLSLFNTGSMHIFEPYWNHSRLAQIFGRGSRYCSHKLLPKEKRILQIFMYISTTCKGEKTIDGYIFEMMKEKKALLNDFYKVLKKVAVDRELNKNAIKYAKDDI